MHCQKPLGTSMRLTGRMWLYGHLRKHLKVYRWPQYLAERYTLQWFLTYFFSHMSIKLSFPPCGNEDYRGRNKQITKTNFTERNGNQCFFFLLLSFLFFSLLIPSYSSFSSFLASSYSSFSSLFLSLSSFLLLLNQLLVDTALENVGTNSLSSNQNWSLTPNFGRSNPGASGTRRDLRRYGSLSSLPVKFLTFSFGMIPVSHLGTTLKKRITYCKICVF